jgi:hypothetical protein
MKRKTMFEMARDNDIETIARLLDEGVDPHAGEERNYSVSLLDELCQRHSIVSFLFVVLNVNECEGLLS